MAAPKTRLRKREIIAAFAIGGVATLGAAGLILNASDEPRERESHQQVVTMDGRQTYTVGEFEGIAVVGPQDVVVTRGDSYSVRAEGPGEALARFEVVVEDGILQIRPADGFEGDWSDGEDMTFFVTVPRLSQFVLGGTGDVEIDRVEGDRFEGVVAGTGELNIGNMQVQDADFTIVGAGDLVAAGTAQAVSVKIAGAGEVNATDLRSRTADLDIAGAGDVALNVLERANISVVGSGDVEVVGGAQCSLSRIGTGSVTCNGTDVDD